MADLGISWSTNIEAKATVMLCWCVGSYFLYHYISRVLYRNRTGEQWSRPAVTKDDLDVSGRIVSFMHCTPVVVTSLYTILTSSPLDFTDANGLEPTIGSFGLCISVAYFTYDMKVLIETNFHPLKPMIAHHILSGSCMCLIAMAVPRAAWYACMLQSTEATAPINIAIYFLHRRSGHKGMYLYSFLRWTQLALWLVMRELLFVQFAYLVWRDWASMPPVMKALGWVTGLPLALFNTAGLFKVVLPGFPWKPEKQA